MIQIFHSSFVRDELSFSLAETDNEVSPMAHWLSDSFKVAVFAIPGAVATLESGSQSLSSRMAWRMFLDWSRSLLWGEHCQVSTCPCCCCSSSGCDSRIDKHLHWTHSEIVKLMFLSTVETRNCQVPDNKSCDQTAVERQEIDKQEKCRADQSYLKE